jgi:hypothetical protein
LENNQLLFSIIVYRNAWRGIAKHDSCGKN